MHREEVSLDKTPTTICIYVQPRAGRDEVVGRHGDAVKIRLKAAPVDGKANEALIRMLAKATGLPRAAVRIAHGKTGRRKRVEFDGMTEAEVLAALGL